MRIVPPLAVVALGAVAVSQIPTFDGTAHSSDWPASFAAGPFRRIECGRLTPDPLPDVVVLNGAQPAVSFGTDAFDAFRELPEIVNDVDVLPRIPGQQRDGLVVVGASGLRELRYDPASDQFVARTLFAGPWLDAVAVHAVDLDRNGVTDLVGIAQNGVDVLVAQGSVVVQVGGPGGTQTAQLAFLSWSTWSASAPVTGVVELEWDGDALHELALATDQGVEVRDYDGTLLDAWDGVFPGGSIARVAHDDSPTDWLVWVTALTAQGWEWMFTLSAGDVVESSVQLGVLGTVGLLGVDYDQDGDGDVLVSQRYSHEAIVVFNRRQAGVDPAPVFSNQPADLELLPIGPSATAHPENQLARPAACDLDHDGDPDVVFATESSRTLFVFRGEAVAEDDYRVDLANAVYAWDGGATGTLTHDLTEPATVPVGATHVLALGWRRPGVDEPIESAQALPEQRIPRGAWPLSATHVIPESDPGFTNVYTLQYAFMREAPDGSIVELWPIGTWDFTLDGDVFDDLRNLDGAGVTHSVTAGGQIQDGGTYGGGFVSFPGAGDWDEDDWPDWEGDGDV